MARDFNTNSDISPDTGNDVSSGDAGSDFGGNLGDDEGVDLNVPERQDTSNTDKTGFSKADMVAPPPEIMDSPVLNDDVPAIYQEAPANVGAGPEAIDLNQYYQPDERERMIEEGMGPGPETNVEEFPDAEYADAPPDPPQDVDMNVDMG